ncbi:glycosyltransferase [bacterium]|nr:glycosyltransferase [bacterium]
MRPFLKLMTEKDHIQLSFILPMYNVERFLDKCIQSLVQQNLARGTFEIILVNDGSKDNTLAIAQRWASEWPEIKIVDQKNSGQSAARNAGINLARGEYIWFIDSDDYIFEKSSLCLLNLAKKNKLDLLTFDVTYETSNHKPLSVFSDKKEIQEVFSGEVYIAKYNYNNSPCLYLVRREFLMQTGIKFIEGVYCEDGLFTMSIISEAEKIAHYPSAGYVYFNNSSSTTKSKLPSHYIKIANDFVFAIAFIENYISASQGLRCEEYLQRLKSRKDSYIFFLCIRLIQSGLKSSEVLEWYGKLIARRWIPLLHFSHIEYPGVKYKLAKFFINHRLFFTFLTFISRFAKGFSK